MVCDTWNFYNSRNTKEGVFILIYCCFWKNKLFHRFLLFYFEFQLIEAIQRFLFGFLVYEQ